jgi:hypothetical protein
MSDAAGGNKDRPRSETKAKKHPPSRADFEATVADIEAQVRATNDRINAKSGRNLLSAVLIGLALGGSLIVSLVFIKELFMVFGAILLVFTSFELASALRFAGRDVLPELGARNPQLRHDHLGHAPERDEHNAGDRHEPVAGGEPVERRGDDGERRDDGGDTRHVAAGEAQGTG